MPDVEDIERENAKLKSKLAARDGEITVLKNRIALGALLARGVDKDYASEVLLRKHSELVTLKDGVVDEEELESRVGVIVAGVPAKFVGEAAPDAPRSTSAYDPVAEGKRMAKEQRARQGLDNDNLAFR